MSKSDSSINDKMREMQSKYSSSPTTTPVKKEANLMIQMNLYDNEKINNNISELEEIYDSQVERLNTLKEEDPVSCMKKCNDFLEENDEIINEQLDTIINLEKNIKNVINQCEVIEKQEEKLNDMVKEPKYVDLAEKIKKIRGTVDNLNLFLVKKKITNYKN